MEFFEVIEKRKTCRSFSTEPPSKDIVKKIIDSARMAPSARNRQPWHFVAIYNQSVKDKLVECVERKYDEIAQLSAAKTKIAELEASKGFSTFFNDAPVLIAVYTSYKENSIERILKNSSFESDVIAKMRPLPDLQSTAAAIENLSLAATACGYSTCWMTAPIVAYKEMEAVLNQDSNSTLVALIALGKPAEAFNSKIIRKKLDEILTFID